jgi:hypothetical protein
MPAVYLNYHDVRKLVAALGEKYIESPYLLAPDLVIARALGSNHHTLRQALTGDHFDNELSSDVLPEHTGVRLTYPAYCHLRHVIVNEKFDAMKNTKRLEVIAGILGWKADALMHSLKTTTAHLGRNPTIPGPLEVPALSQLIGPHEADWCRLLDSGPGLFLISGRTGDGISTTLVSSLKYLIKDAVDATILESSRFTDQGREHGSLGDGVSGKVIAMQIFSAEDAKKALELSQSNKVLASFHATSYHEAYTSIQKLCGRQGHPLTTLRGHILQRWDPMKRVMEVELTKTEDRTFGQGWADVS